MNAEADKWSHLDPYEQKYLKEVIQAYDEIMEITSDIPQIASYYQLSIEAVRRAKDYAFGQGVSTYQFSPDPKMSAAWMRMSLGQGNELDEIFLRHEIYESDLVINQDFEQSEAHQITQKRYPWSDLVNQT